MRLTDENLPNILKISISQTQPDVDELSKNIQEKK